MRIGRTSVRRVQSENGEKILEFKMTGSTWVPYRLKHALHNILSHTKAGGKEIHGTKKKKSLNTGR